MIFSLFLKCMYMYWNLTWIDGYLKLWKKKKWNSWHNKLSQMKDPLPNVQTKNLITGKWMQYKMTQYWKQINWRTVCDIQTPVPYKWLKLLLLLLLL